MKLTGAIIQGLSDCFIIWKQELQQVFKDIGVILMFIVVPVVYPILYGLIYNTEVMRETPMVVVDESHSSLAREFVRKIDATPDVQVFAYASSLEEAREWVNRHKAYGILLIPSDFSQKINRGEQAVTALYIDMSGMLYYKAILLATTEAGFDLGAKIQVQQEAPIIYESVPFYNTQNGFASFLLPAILILIIQQTLLLGIGILVATTRERNQGRLIPEGSYYTGTFRIIFGKALTYLTIYVFVCFWMLMIVPHIFHIPQLTHYSSLLLFNLPYLLACIFFAMVVATFIRGREMPMMLLVITSVPLLFLSGISWPVSAMPDFWRYFSYLFPSTFGIQGFVKINSMGATLWEIAFEYRMLWLQTGVYFIIAYLIYRKQVK
ncbi:membrane protein [Bacteroidia bacterium]|nr:membrane protein [Bacteroidia bacterium]